MEKELIESLTDYQKYLYRQVIRRYSIEVLVVLGLMSISALVLGLNIGLLLG